MNPAQKSTEQAQKYICFVEKHLPGSGFIPQNPNKSQSPGSRAFASSSSLPHSSRLQRPLTFF
jgi:hypothetical protein